MPKVIIMSSDFECETHDTLVLVRKMEKSIFQQVSSLLMG